MAFELAVIESSHMKSGRLRDTWSRMWTGTACFFLSSVMRLIFRSRISFCFLKASAFFRTSSSRLSSASAATFSPWTFVSSALRISDQPAAATSPSPRMPTRRKFWLPPKSSLKFDGALAFAALRSASRLILIIGSVPHLSEGKPHRDGCGRGHVVQDLGGNLTPGGLDASEGVQDLDLRVETLAQGV